MGADPWSMNYFDPPTPHVPAPSPKARAPKPVPEPDRLFVVQRHALEVINDLEELEKLLGHHQDRKLGAVLARLDRHSEHTYRVIRTYLAEHVEPGQ